MKKYAALFDIVFYLILPYVIWTYGREGIGDYYALLLSTAPGIIYTLYRFFVQKQFNVTGLFILSSMTLGTTIDLLSGSAEKMLWHQVYFGIGIGILFLLSILLNKPLGMYFFIDFAALRGYKREDSYRLFTSKELYRYFLIITGVFALRSIFQAGLKGYFLYQYGVDYYDRILVFMRISGWVFSAILILGYILIGNRITQMAKKT